MKESSEELVVTCARCGGKGYTMEYVCIEDWRGGPYRTPCKRCCGIGKVRVKRSTIPLYEAA